MYIAIDTSTEIAGLALARNGEILAETTWRCGQNHTIQLLPALSGLLKQVGVSLTEATGIIVATGPGSYNGLRVGLSTAKGLAFALDIPLVGISTLAVEAYQAALGRRDMPIYAISDAGRGEIAVAAYTIRGDRWVQLVPEHVTTVEGLLSDMTSPAVFCGEHALVIADAITGQLGEKATIISGAAGLRRAGYLVELGLRRLKTRDFDDTATLQPLYLRAPPITQPKNK